MGKKNEVSVNGRLELSRAISHLESLARSMRDGTIYIRQGNEFVGLTPQALVDVDIEATQKKNRESVTIRLSWKKMESLNEAEDVTINSIRPEIPEEPVEEEAHPEPAPSTF